MVKGRPSGRIRFQQLSCQSACCSAELPPGANKRNCGAPGYVFQHHTGRPRRCALLKSPCVSLFPSRTILVFAVLALFGKACLPAALAETNPPAISVATVSQLRPVLAFRTGSPHGHAGAPAVSGSNLFVLTPFPHTLFAFDLARPGFPLKWQFQPKQDGRAEGLACCDTINAGPTVVGGRRAHHHARRPRDRARSGQRRRAIGMSSPADLGKGETLTGAPAAVDGARPGRQQRRRLRRARLDRGARCRGRAGSFGAGSAPARMRTSASTPERGRPGPSRTPALHSWSNAGWQHGGGEVSGPIVADPDGATVYHGTGHAAPWNPDQRLGDNSWTSSLFARDAKTGAVRWVDQLARHDDFALGSTGALLLADRDWHGAAPQAADPPRPERLSLRARPDDGRDPVGASLHDRERDERRRPGVGRRDPGRQPQGAFATMTRDVCPGWPGRDDRAAPRCRETPTSSSFPVSRLCMDLEARNVSYHPGHGLCWRERPSEAPSDGMRGAARGLGSSRARSRPGAWRRRFRSRAACWPPTASSSTERSTARSRRSTPRAAASCGGSRRRPASSGSRSPSRRRTGRSYVAVLAGLGGPFGIVARNGIDKRDATAAHGMANALADLPEPADPSGTLYVFGLP